MDAVSDPEVRTVVVKGSARIGKTEFENNVIGFHIAQDPSPMLLVYPSEQKAQDYSKEKLSPMLKNTPALRGLVADAKSRDSKNTLNHKVFQGGYLAMVGSNTPNGLDSRTVRLVLFDELDKCAKAARHLGDPIALAKNRTITYPGRWKHVLVSTPSEEGDSPITAEYEKTDMRRHYVPCPHCGTFEVLKMAQIKWGDGPPEDAVYVCEHCGCPITDADKSRMLAKGQWRAENGPHKGSVGFWIWAAYSPWVTWGLIASTFVERLKDGPEAFKTFVNEWLGETWNPNQGRESKVEGLLKRARESRYSSGTVPDQVGILFGASDTQDDRLEVLIRGVGVGRKQWTIEHIVIEGNTGTKDPWDRLETLVLANWPREDGQLMRVKKFCVDVGGHMADQAKAFCKRPRLKGIVTPIRGATRPQANLVIQGRKRSPVWYVDTIAIKDTIYAALRIDNPAIPGYQQFPNDTEAGYFQQLLVEKKIKGKYEPVPAGARNEIIDLHTYCDGAMALWRLRPGELESLVQFYVNRSANPAEPGDPEEEPVMTTDPIEHEAPEDLESQADPEPEPAPPPPEPERPKTRPERKRRPRVPKVPRGGGLMGW
jgi:phage terminase large subunit GpA-like protein